ncbi:MAG: ATP synthase F1 subunit epsilon [Bryobacteraceae bacterium]|jgi:F-type H+-transporting ATPase subunit epsilon
MPDWFELEVATPERLLVRANVESAQLPGSNGSLGILPGHAPLADQLGAGLLSYSVGGRPRYLAVSGGFIEVLPGRVRVLADVAERPEEIDVDRARAALERARQAAANAATPEDAVEASEAVERAEARLAAAERK